MTRRFGMCLLVLGLVSCRDYDFRSPIADQDGLVPPDQFARYGREQAEAVAIGREFGHSGRADSAMVYAKTLPDVTRIEADTLGFRLTVQFKSGWRTGVAPIDDGKRGADTPGLAAAQPKR